MDSNKLFKNTIIYAIGNFGSKVLSFLLIPLYSFYLSKEDLGYYDLITTSIVLLIPFLSLQTSDAVYRWLLDSYGDRTKISSAIINGLSILLVSFIFFSIAFIIAIYFFTIQYAFYSLLVLMATALFVFFQQAVRGLGKNKLYSIVGVVYTLIFLLLNAAFLFGTDLKVEGLLISTIVANLIAIFILIRWGKLFSYIDYKDFDLQEVKKMIAYSGPLIPNTVSWWLINEVNRFIILYYLGLNANGIFALANRFPSLILAVNSIFMLAWQDHAIASKSVTDKAKDSSDIFNVFMKLELTLVILLTCFTKTMMHLFVDAKFYDSWQYIPILYLAVVFSSFSAFLGTSYLNSKNTSGIFYTAIWGSLINVIVAVGTIRLIGLFAPTLGMVSGFLCMWLVRVHKSKDFHPFDFNKRVFIFLLITSVCFVFLIHISSNFIQVVITIVAIFLFLYFNKPLFVTLITKAKRILPGKRHYE